MSFAMELLPIVELTIKHGNEVGFSGVWRTLRWRSPPPIRDFHEALKGRICARFIIHLG